MKHISKRISVILLSTVICCVFCESTVFALSKIGSRGQEVTNIQTRLKSWDITAEILTEYTVGVPPMR